MLCQQNKRQYVHSGCSSSIGNVSAWHASGPEFDPHVRHILSWRFGHEKISTAIPPPPLIQEEQLSVAGERMCTKYQLTAYEAFPGDSVVRVTDRA